MDFNDYCKNKTFDDFSDEYLAQSKLQNNKTNVQNLDQEEIKQKLNKYQNMSNNDLMMELIKETNKQKESGDLDNQKIAELGKKLKPMLDSSAQTKLDEILRMLR